MLKIQNVFLEHLSFRSPSKCKLRRLELVQTNNYRKNSSSFLVLVKSKEIRLYSFDLTNYKITFLTHSWFLRPMTEAVNHGCSSKHVFLTLWQNSQVINCTMPESSRSQQQKQLSNV